MLSGRQALDHLNTTVQQLRTTMQQLENELLTTSDRIAKNQQKQSKILKHLAAVRLDAIQSGEINRRLDSADHKVDALLSERSRALSDLNRNIDREEQELHKLEDQRSSIHEEVDNAAAILAQRETEVQTVLDADTAFQKQLKQARDADAVAVSAIDKAAVALENRKAKGAPYEEDVLFSYLWESGYGTSEYRANPLVRTLDAWVARLCNYTDARPNYWMLLEIPKRLQQHASKVRITADTELAHLQGLEKKAAERGGVTDARQALAEIEQRQDHIDAKIKDQEAALHELRNEQNAYTAGNDEYLKRCLNILSEAMQHRDINSLTQLTLATQTLEDDSLINDLRHTREYKDNLEQELEQHRSLHQEHLIRLRELEKIRYQFKRHRFDDYRSSFDNSDMLLMLMRQVLTGTVSAEKLWETMTRYQRYRDVGGGWPDFGSGGIFHGERRPTNYPPTWHWPGSMGSGRGGFRIPSGGGGSISGSRGGFRTGGGF